MSSRASSIIPLPASSAEPLTKAKYSLVSLAWLLIAFTPVFFAVCTWTNLGKGVFPYAPMRLFGLPVIAVEHCFLGFAAFSGWTPSRSWARLSISTRVMLVAIVIIACSTAMFSAPNRQAAVLWTYFSFVHLLFGFAAYWLAERATKQQRAMIWPSIILGICAYEFLLLIFVNEPHPANFDWQYLGFGVSNVRQLSYYCVPAAATALVLAAERRSTTAVLYFAAAVLSVGVAIWSGSRGALLALFGGLAATALIFPQMSRVRLSIFGISAGLLASWLAKLQPPPLPVVFGGSRIASLIIPNTQDDISSGRMAMWSDAVHAILKRPLFGYGEAQFGWATPHPNGAIYLHPHDIFLQVLVQWGVIGAAIISTLSYRLGAQSMRARGLAPPEMLAASAVILSIAVFSLYDGALFNTYPVMMFIFSLALAAAGARGSGEAERSL